MSENLSLTFTITADDIIKWNQYLLEHNPVLKRYMIKITWGVAMALIVIGAILSAMTHNPEAITVLSIAAVLYVLIMPFAQKRRFNLYKKALAEDKSKIDNSKRILKITDDGLVVSSETGDGKAYWNGIQQIIEIPQYTFIDIGAMNAYVVPEQRIEEGDYNTFVAKLKHRWEQSPKEQITQ